MRYYDNGWKKLETRELGYTGDYINYEADTAGFSYFVIAISEEAKANETEKERIVAIAKKEISSKYGTKIIVSVFAMILAYACYIIYQLDKKNQRLRRKLLQLREFMKRSKRRR